MIKRWSLVYINICQFFLQIQDMRLKFPKTVVIRAADNRAMGWVERLTKIVIIVLCCRKMKLV